MADTVEKNVENMLTELEQMKRVKLFNEDEIRMILKQRRQFEYLLQKKKKKVKDFQAYINHEVRILALLKLRRPKIGYGFKKEDIEKPIMSRLEWLHRLLCHQFPSDLTHWVARMKLLESFGKYNAVNKTWTKCFQLHPNANPRVWITCVHWLLHKRPDLETPKKMQAIIRNKRNILRAGKSASSKIRAMEKSQHLDEDELQDLTSAVETEIRQISYQHRLEGFKDARIVLTQAVQNLPESQELHRELVKLEAIQMDYLKFCYNSGLKRMIDLLGIEEDLSSVESGAILKIVLDEILSKWPNDLNFIQSIVEIVDNIPCLTGSPILSDLHELHVALLQQDKNAKQQPVMKDQVYSESDNLLIDMMVLATSEDTLAIEKFYKSHQRNLKIKLSYDFFSYYIDYLFNKLDVCDEENEEEIESLSKKVRHEFQLECDNWGKKKLEFWLKYLYFEEKYGDPLRVSELHHQAGKYLPEKLFSELNFARSYGNQ